MFSVIITNPKNKVVISSVINQIDCDDDLIIEAMTPTPARILDDIIRRARFQPIILINPDSDILPEGYIKTIKNNYTQNSFFIIRTEDSLPDYSVEGKITDITINDIICFSKMFYRTSLRDINSSLSYIACIRILNKLIRPIRMLSGRTSLNYNKMIKTIKIQKELYASLLGKTDNIENQKIFDQIKEKQEILDEIQKEEIERRARTRKLNDHDIEIKAIIEEDKRKKEFWNNWMNKDE